jgi:hypothetical protein
MKRRGDYPASSRKESKNAPSSAPGVYQGKSSNGKFPVGGGDMSVSHHSRVSALSNSSVPSCHAMVSNLSGTKQGVPTIVSPTKSDQSSEAVPSQASVSTPMATAKKNFQARYTVTPSRSVQELSSPSASRLQCASINWLSRSMVLAEILKYEANKDNIPKCQEDQLLYLMGKFGSPDLKVAYHCIVGKLGLDFTSVQLPYNPKKDTVISYFIALIFNHRSIMYDSSSDAHR